MERRAALLVGGLLCSLLAVGGCGAGPAGSGPPPALGTAAASPDPVRPPGYRPEPGSAANTPQPVPLLHRPPDEPFAVMPWELLALQQGGRRLIIRYLPAAGCQAPLGVFAQATATVVLLAPLARLPRSGELCPAIALFPLVGYVDLASPLGTRKLLHPPTAPGLVAELHNRPPRPSPPG